MLYSLFAVPGIIWAVSCAAAGVALYGALGKGNFNFKRTFIFAVVALAIAAYGFGHFQLSASETVNGVVRWSINSKWFFLAALGLSGTALAATFWKRAQLEQPAYARAVRRDNSYRR